MMETDAGSMSSASTSFVNMSVLEQGQVENAVGESAEPQEVVVETVTDDPLLSPQQPPTIAAVTPTAAVATPVAPPAPMEVETSENDSESMGATGPTTFVLAFVPRSQAHAVRIGMTLLLGLLVTAVVFSLSLAPQYFMLLSLFWVLLISLFSGLVWFIQTAVLQNKSTVFHPIIHAAAAAVLQEYHAFTDDWREEVLMLTNEAVNPEMQATGTTMPNDAYVPPKPRKGKSKLFRLVVRPFLPMMRRRKRRKGKQEEATFTGAYVPPVVVNEVV